MVAVGMRLEGGARLRRTLKAAGGDLSDFTELNREVANIVLPVARSTSPFGPDAGGHIRTTVRAGATRKAAIIRAGTAGKPYAPPVHWGWFRRNILPQPWVSIAAQQTEPVWTERYFAGLIRIIQKVRGAEPS